jgi:hypothetical protein
VNGRAEHRSRRQSRGEDLRWSPLDPPEWIFTSHDGVINDYLHLHFAEWWQRPQIGRPWVTMRDFLEPLDAYVWWDLGQRCFGRMVRPPMIEVAAEPPPDWLPVELPFAVGRAGWWIVAGIGPEEARRWIDIGEPLAHGARAWPQLLGEEIQVRFPGTDLARSVRGVWRATDAGLVAVKGFNELGIRLRDLDRPRPRQLASYSAGRLDVLFDELRCWSALLRPAIGRPDGSAPRDADRPAAQAVAWLCTGVGLVEGAEWIDAGFPSWYEAMKWWRVGFTPAGATRWRVEGADVDPGQARQWHLALHGESEGLGPDRECAPWRGPFKPPSTKAERRSLRQQQREELWIKATNLVRRLLGRPL